MPEWNCHRHIIWPKRLDFAAKTPGRKRHRENGQIYTPDISRNEQILLREQNNRKDKSGIPIIILSIQRRNHNLWKWLFQSYLFFGWRIGVPHQKFPADTFYIFYQSEFKDKCTQFQQRRNFRRGQLIFQTRKSVFS